MSSFRPRSEAGSPSPASDAQAAAIAASEAEFALAGRPALGHHKGPPRFNIEAGEGGEERAEWLHTAIVDAL
jgi:hypothetical protein